MSYIIIAMTSLRATKRFIQSIASPDTQSVYEDICQEISLAGWGWEMPNITMGKKPTSILSLVNRQVVAHADDYLYLWMVSTSHVDILRRVIESWVSQKTSEASYTDAPQISYSNVMAGFYMALANEQASEIAELKLKIDTLSDNPSSNASWDEGYNIGVSDGVLMVSREHECSVVSEKIWRNNQGRNSAAMWQMLYSEQLAIATANQKRVSELHQLLDATIPKAPIDGIRMELIDRLHTQAKVIENLTYQIDVYDSVDYAQVIDVQSKTGLDEWLNVANLVEKESMIETIQKAMANGGKV